MTVRECYEKIGSDFDKVLGRMGSEALVKRFAVKFLEDKSFEELTESLKEKDGEDAFRAAHTLKGICANLGLDRLYEADCELTESCADVRPRAARRYIRRWQKRTKPQ